MSVWQFSTRNVSSKTSFAKIQSTLFLILKKHPSQNLLFVFIDMVSYCLCKTVIGCPRTKSGKYVTSSLQRISFETSTHVSFRLSFSSTKTYVLITTEVVLNRLSDYNGQLNSSLPTFICLPPSFVSPYSHF
jgi:hypothetical protein